MASGVPATIVFVHADGELPNPWFRAYRRIRTAVRRAAYNARVEQCSLTDLIAEPDVLVIPSALETVTAGLTARLGRIVAAPEAVGLQIDQLVARLAEEGHLGRTTAPARAIAVHRGFMPVTERARLSE